MMKLNDFNDTTLVSPPRILAVYCAYKKHAVPLQNQTSYSITNEFTIFLTHHCGRNTKLFKNLHILCSKNQNIDQIKYKNQIWIKRYYCEKRMYLKKVVQNCDLQSADTFLNKVPQKHSKRVLGFRIGAPFMVLVHSSESYHKLTSEFSYNTIFLWKFANNTNNGYYYFLTLQ